ncbi:predicted protein [Verticillium alfalfae VaMs.102]|uniref:Predicted protein n=1 Tax=Verticillium alfalfae (strain VaMs.102 / ATCC MYA-4576 / FGSC 10136) TaxID=526221 RepID=C9SXV5_VERA1|nr:predicted protein [Verticillium alfalfae VaMs.102]EEY23620.1 predicted protein [Verticillium alfalfae VaMs.102]
MPTPGSTPGQAPLCPPAHRQSWHSTTGTTQYNHVNQFSQVAQVEVNQASQLGLLRDLPSPALVLPTPPPLLLSSTPPRHRDPPSGPPLLRPIFTTSTPLPINRNLTSTGITAGIVPL